MSVLRRAHPLAAFCGSGLVSVRVARSRPTSQLAGAVSVPPARGPVFRGVAVPALHARSAALARSVLRFQKPPSDGAGGGGGGGGDGGFFGWFRGFGGGGGGDGDGGLFARLVALYTHAVTRRPVLTKASSTLLIGLGGDASAQRIAARGKEGRFALDLRRFASVGLWSFCFMGPVLHYWYGALDRVFFGRYAVLYKLLSDQIMFAPCFNSAFIAGVGALEGVRDVGKAVRDRFWPSMKANWMLWPAAQTVNFAVVPKQWQILYVNCIGFAWTVILTYITHSSKTASQNAVVAKSG